MMSTLDTLLLELRDRPPAADALGAVLSRARDLVLVDDRIPAEMRDIVFVDPAEASSDAAGLLAVLGLDNLGDLLAAAIQSELGEGEQVAASLVEDEVVWAPIGATIRSAVVAAAGPVEVVEPVLQHVGLREFRVPVRAAVYAAAGNIDVAPEVLAALGLREREVPVAAAVRAEAGPVDVVEPVLERVAPQVRVPAPANDPRPFAWMRATGWAATALVAAAAVLLAIGRGDDDGMRVAAGGLLPAARAGEVVIEDLALGAGVEVVELEGADGSVILWVDEEA